MFADKACDYKAVLLTGNSEGVHPSCCPLSQWVDRYRFSTPGNLWKTQHGAVWIHSGRRKVSKKLLWKCYTAIPKRGRNDDQQHEIILFNKLPVFECKGQLQCISLPWKTPLSWGQCSYVWSLLLWQSKTSCLQLAQQISRWFSQLKPWTNWRSGHCKIFPVEANCSTYTELQIPSFLQQNFCSNKSPNTTTTAKSIRLHICCTQRAVWCTNLGGTIHQSSTSRSIIFLERENLST